jgi:hypothetical protein
VKRRLALIAGLSLAGCGTQPATVHRLHAGTPTTTTTTSAPPPEPADPTAVDWDGIARIAEAQRHQRATRSRAAAPAPSVAATLACIRRWESHGNYQDVSPDGKYRGAYQFDRQTFESVGGHGDPAAASPAAQDAAAARLLARRGLQPWPTPSRKCA